MRQSILRGGFSAVNWILRFLALALAHYLGLTPASLFHWPHVVMRLVTGKISGRLHICVACSAHHVSCLRVSVMIL